ncbi:recombinase [Clostridiaceae bacterium]|nr:recombinase [Clostridiaceae bacterium]RKI16773.1 recombinase [bacterium 1XD21-70]
MENRKKKAWIYTRIDAPEDSHGTLKKQYEQLNTYGEQFQMKIAGSSSDMGEETRLERSGLNLFLEAKDSREIEVLLILDSSRISRDKNLCREFLCRMTKAGLRCVLLWRGFYLSVRSRRMKQEVHRWIIT